MKVKISENSSRRALTKDDLVSFLRRQFSEHSFLKLDPEEVSVLILNQPSFGDIIVDNYIDNRTRSFFYRLETIGIMKSFSQFIKIAKKGYWRIHFWKIERERVFRESLEESHA